VTNKVYKQWNPNPIKGGKNVEEESEGLANFLTQMEVSNPKSNITPSKTTDTRIEIEDNTKAAGEPTGKH